MSVESCLRQPAPIGHVAPGIGDMMRKSPVLWNLIRIAHMNADLESLSAL